MGTRSSAGAIPRAGTWRAGTMPSGWPYDQMSWHVRPDPGRTRNRRALMAMRSCSAVAHGGELGPEARTGQLAGGDRILIAEQAVHHGRGDGVLTGSSRYLRERPAQGVPAAPHLGGCDQSVDDGLQDGSLVGQHIGSAATQDGHLSRVSAGWTAGGMDGLSLSVLEPES